MAYQQIQSIYYQLYNITIKSCWIADAKRQMGIPVNKAYNRIGKEIKHKCPQKHISRIKALIKAQK